MAHTKVMLASEARSININIKMKLLHCNGTYTLISNVSRKKKFCWTV